MFSKRCGCNQCWQRGTFLDTERPPLDFKYEVKPNPLVEKMSQELHETLLTFYKAGGTDPVLDWEAQLIRQREPSDPVGVFIINV